MKRENEFFITYLNCENDFDEWVKVDRLKEKLKMKKLEK
jgi:hypothetical protein